MKKKECPSCAMVVEAKYKTCPICGYEFTGFSSGIKWTAIVLLLVLLYLILRQVFN